MDIRAITDNDYPLLESTGGYIKQYGQNVQRWIRNGYVTVEDCYVFISDDLIVGGVCFCDDAAEERLILDFALTNEEMPNGARALKKAVNIPVKADTRSTTYHLYNDTEQYTDILNVFIKAGFCIAQEKKSFTYELKEPPRNTGGLIFRSISETGEEMFIKTVRDVTVGSLDKLMAEDAERLGGDMAAREYVNSVKKIDCNEDWWRLGYCGSELIGLILPQMLSDSIGGINYVGVLPQCRGCGYGAILIAEGTRLLHENGAKKIIADIDVNNFPMHSALERVGFSFKMKESVLTFNH